MFTILNVVRVSWVYTYAHCTLLNRTYEIHTVYCVPIIASVIFRILLFSFREFGGKGESRNAAYLEGDMGSSMDFGFFIKLGYVIACLYSDEGRGQTDAKVRGTDRILEWAGKSGLVCCVRRRHGPWRRGQLIHNGSKDKGKSEACLMRYTGSLLVMMIISTITAMRTVSRRCIH